VRRPWVPLVLMGLGLLPILVLWSAGDVEHAQGRILDTMILGAVTVLLVLLWVVFLSPLPRKARIGVAGLAVAALLLVRIEGTSGDLVPSLAVRGFGRRAVAEVAASASALKPGSFPGFFGPARDGAVDVALDPDWAARPPRLLWRRPVGAAWSGFTVEAGRAVTQEQDGGRELVTAYDLATGRPLWRQATEARFETTLAGLGPRATPTIDRGWVYALGALGRLSCIELATGTLRWSVDIGAPLPEYGFASSPWVDGDLVIVHAGGPLAAFDRATGERRWTSTSDDVGYASPRIVELAGRRQLVAIHKSGCAGYDPANGERLWRYAWRDDIPKVAQPVPIGGDRLVISAGYGVGADAFRIGPGTAVTPLWSSKRLKAKMSSVVHRDGHLYGLDDGRLVCVAAETGEKVWAGERYGHGQLLRAGELLVVSAETGLAALVEASPAAFRERARLQVVEGKTWNPPCLAGPYLLLRNAQEAACLELPLR
jgi:outer membrane protein assembly factor BamB